MLRISSLTCILYILQAIDSDVCRNWNNCKKLYFSTGGEEAAEDKDLYFDTDCLDRLENLWTMSKKVILVSHPNFMLSDESNILTPLHKAHKRGRSSAD